MIRKRTKYPIVNGVMTYPDGREVCLFNSRGGKAEYKRRTQEMSERQDNLCALCGKWMDNRNR